MIRTAARQNLNAAEVVPPAQIVCLSGARLRIATTTKRAKYTIMSLTAPVVPVVAAVTVIRAVAASIAVTPFAAGALRLAIYAPKGAVKSIANICKCRHSALQIRKRMIKA